MIDEKFIAEVERQHFRTDEDTGANSNGLMIWNLVRKEFGYVPLMKQDLPAFCTTHKCYHIIKGGYGCARKIPGQAL